jgi:glyoxylase-like metal-dependent hydrolase (beta-lactamase superfamily II)
VQPTPANLPSTSQPPAAKPPRVVLEGVYAFPPNRDTMGGTAYFILENSSATPSNILVDCPAWNLVNQAFLEAQGGVRWLVLTHRGAIGKVQEIQQTFGCEVVMQEQEAYLLPGMPITPFQQEITLSEHAQVIWTPGHSPGSACLYSDRHDGILFTGRHLLPNTQGEPVPLRISKTFHWRRQIQSIQKLRDRFTPKTLTYLCPGANTGFLRGKGAIDRAYKRLEQLDLNVCLQAQPLL